MLYELFIGVFWLLVAWHIVMAFGMAAGAVIYTLNESVGAVFRDRYVRTGKRWYQW